MEIIIRTAGKKAASQPVPPAPAEPPPEVAARAAATGAISAGAAPAPPVTPSAPVAIPPSPQIVTGPAADDRSAGAAPTSL